MSNDFFFVELDKQTKLGHPTNQTHGSMAAVSATTTTTTTKTTTTTMSLMDDTQLPARFQRKPISELEMQLIEVRILFVLMIV